MKRTEDSLRDLWNNNKCTNILVMGSQRKKKKKEGTEKIFKEIIFENFPNMGKEIVNQIQEVQSSLQLNPRRNTSRHILIKLTEIKHKERILKAAREKQ